MDSLLRGAPPRRVDLAVVLLAAAGVAVWWLSVANLPLSEMTDLGLVSVFPVGVWIGFLLVGSSFVVAVRAGRNGAVILSLAATVLVLHGLGVVGEHEMRFSVAWRHVGIADYLRTRGAIDPTLDAYQNWPGFFAVTAFIWQATGIVDPTPVLAWAPVVHNVLYLLPLIAIGNRLFRDRTIVWVGAWLFTVGNWIGQDYFSPQGWYLFIYLTVMAVILQWFSLEVPAFEEARAAGAAGQTEPSSTWRRWMWSSAAPALSALATCRRRRLVLLALVLLLCAVTIVGHQLTPFVLVLGTAAVALLGWSRLRTLPVVLVLATLAWTGYAAAAYSAGHPDTFNQFGAFTSIFQQTVEKRLSGSPGHALIARLRLMETAFLWGLALLGAYRLVRRKRRHLARGLIVLALCPYPVVAAQSYGGEGLMRVTLFALPFIALLAAAGLVGMSRSTRLRTVVPVLVVGVLLVSVFPFTRYGNERMDFYTPDEVLGVQQMYRLAPQGAVLTSVTGGLPWRSTHYADDQYRVLSDGNAIETSPDAGLVGTVDLDNPDRRVLATQVATRMVAGPGQRSLLIVSRSQGAELDLLGPFPSGAQNRLLAVLRTSPAFRTVYANHDVTVFEPTGRVPS
ncbi:hypothetical protein [Actinomycetospora sp.]|uniref:hypothetical protein n=1 Tax=Actinomycetospora sp. TaxID=1872135 RepID=UPI002F42B52E